MYVVNASWDVVIIGLIVRRTLSLRGTPGANAKPQAYFWVETKGKTLEEIDALFEGEKHSAVPDVELVRKGKEQIDVDAVEQELSGEVAEAKREEA